MAITNPTKLSDFSGFLTPEQSAPIFDRARRLSVAQQLAQQVPMGPTGIAVPVRTGKLSASWVVEGGQKSVSSAGMGLVTMAPKKIAVIAVVSEETVRANPGGFMEAIRGDVAEAFATAFDSASLHGVNTPFGSYVDQTTKAVGLGTSAASAGGVYADFNAGLRLLVNDGKRLSGFALDTVTEPDVNGSVNTTGNPLFIDTPLSGTAPAVRGGSIMGRPAFMGDGVAAGVPGTTSTAYAVGYAGDWTQAAWGVVGGINYAVSTEASVTINGSLQSLWEHNLVALRAEAEYAWMVNDTAAFVKYTKTTPSS